MTFQSKKLRILIADDHQIVIDAISEKLNYYSEEFEVVGAVLNGGEAINLLKKHPVDIAILDINMPELSGLETLKIIKKDYKNTEVLILTMYNDFKHIREVVKNGAKGYILKNRSAKSVVEAIRAISIGEDYFPEEIAQIALNALKPIDNEQETPNLKAILKSITDTESELLSLLTLEHTAKEIANITSVSPKTIEARKKNLMKKLRVKSAMGLVRFAMENGFEKPLN